MSDPKSSGSSSEKTLNLLVERAQKIMAHAWMVRTFIKHAPETEDFPELMGIVRSVFDTSRALETRIETPAGYFKMLGKKLGKMKAATAQFAIDAPQASTHTNFAQAVISMQTAVEDLQQCLIEYQKQNMASAIQVEPETDEEVEESAEE